MPSPNEFNFLADRVAALGRRICRKRELFLRLQGVANRIEENDEWEEKEQRAESENSLASPARLKDARARRRARLLLESSRNDQTMVISQADDPTGSSKVADHADESNRAELSADRSARDADRLQLPTIQMPQKQPRSSSLSALSSTRYSHRDNHGLRGIGTNAACRSYRGHPTSRDGASRPADPPSVSSFSLSSARPRKFGGYRPATGVVMKNLSSGSESESANETSRRFCSARKIDISIATLESSSSASEAAVVNGSVKRAPVLSARSNVANSGRPDLPPATRSLDTRKGCVAERVNRNASDKIKEIRASRGGLAAKTSGKFQRNEDTQAEETPQDTPAFSARNLTPELADFATKSEHPEFTMRDYNEQEDEDERDEKEEAESYRLIAPEVHRDDIGDEFDFDCAVTERRNLEGSSLENTDEEILRAAEWSLLANLCPKKSKIDGVKRDATEDALSSQTSGQIESEDQSRSSCAQMYLQREGTLSSRRSVNGASDRCDQDVATVTNVPALALNSQDISYSTSADSREYSATRAALDPRALIKALSDVSLRREGQGESVSRKREDTIDATSNFLTRGETWRVPRSSESPDSGRPLSRAPSRIPVRISSSKIISLTLAEKPSCCRKSLENLKTANYEEAACVHRNFPQSEGIIRRPEVDWRNESVEDTIVQARIFAPDDKATEYGGYEPGSFSIPRCPQSASFDDYGGARRLPESGRSCPVFFDKTAYSGGRDYVKIDDDVRSRSNYSTSQKSADTLDITSATESPYLSKRKRDLAPNEFFRDAEESATWRTEDECPSINDEENPRDEKDETRCESAELHSQTRERFDLAGEEMYNLSSSKILDLSSEVKRIISKQRASNVDVSSFDRDLQRSEKIPESENWIAHRTRKISDARISPSTLNLNCESKRRKKSQERFPFTISEASGALATEYEDTSDCQLPDKDFRRAKVDEQLEESPVHQLELHPSITRLATEGLDNSLADILCYIAEQEQEDETPSRIKTFMRMFSSKLRKKRSNGSKTVTEPAKIIYENRACQADSRADSCSDEDSAEEARINLKSVSDCWTGKITRSSPTFVSSGYTLKKTESIEAIAQEHPHRKYDRDDLWVQDVKNPSVDEGKDSGTLREENETDRSKESPSKDRYSIFLAKDFQSNIDSKKQHDVISDCITPSDGKNGEYTDRKLSSGFRQLPISEVTGLEEDLTSCFCWRLCRIIAPSRNRPRIKKRVTSPRRKRYSSPLRKRRK